MKKENREEKGTIKNSPSHSKCGYSRRSFLKMSLITLTSTALSVTHIGEIFGDALNKPPSDYIMKDYWWGFIVDTTKCIGCGSCVRACKIENDVPKDYFRTWVERFEVNENFKVGVDSPDGGALGFTSNHFENERVTKGFFVPKLCNHCVTSACTQVCPVGAAFTAPDGVVLVDKTRCIGCGYCVQACPYGSRYVDHAHGVADKCTLCYHRITRGLRTACVEVCPRDARLAGNLLDKDSDIRKILNENRYKVLKEELGTNPKLYYIGLGQEVK